MNTYRLQIKDTFSLVSTPIETIKNSDSYCVYLGLQNLTNYAIKKITDHLALKNFQRIYLNIEQNPKLNFEDIEFLLQSLQKQKKLQELQLYLSENSISKNSTDLLTKIIQLGTLQKLFIGLQGCQIKQKNLKKIFSGFKDKSFEKLYFGINNIKINEDQLHQNLQSIIPTIQCNDLKIRFHELHVFDGPGQRKDTKNLQKIQRNNNLNKELVKLSLIS